MKAATKLTARNPIHELIEAALLFQSPAFLKFVERDAVYGQCGYYRFLYLYTLRHRPAHVLELGTWYGISAHALARGCADTRVYTIDHSFEFWDRCKMPNIEFIKADSLAPVPARFDRIRFDLIFIDTKHNGRFIREFTHWRPYASENCVFCFDDIALNELMIEAWAEFNPPGYEKIETALHGDCGFGILTKKKEAQ